MKYLDESRDPRAIESLGAQIHRMVTRGWTVMQLCGGQAHHVARLGIDRSLPEGLELVHGPGCAVSVTPTEAIDLALKIAEIRGTIVCASSKDLLTVPTAGASLMDARTRGADVRLVYSPLDALSLARREPDREVVFFAVGFETTAPTTAAAVFESERLRLPNFSIIPAHLRASAAISAALDEDPRRVDAILAPGHVASVIGVHELESIALRCEAPIIVTGPDPVDLLDGLLRAVVQLEEGHYSVENQYVRAVRPQGNPQALNAILAVFHQVDCVWRGVGRLPASRLALVERYRSFDAAVRFGVDDGGSEDVDCDPCGEMLSGRIKPNECPDFGRCCTPDHARGPSMITAEGACAAYFRYRRPTQIVSTAGNPIVRSIMG